MTLPHAGPRPGLGRNWRQFSLLVLVNAAHGLRPWPFSLGIGFVLGGLLLSVLAVRETQGHARYEAGEAPNRTAGPSPARVFARTSLLDRDLSAASQAGLVNNLNDGMAWGLFPLLFATAGLGLGEVGSLAAVYPAVWGPGQLVTGGLSDPCGCDHGDCAACR
jgi:hypothetical protein